jgi:hypothetical protein
MDGSGIFSQNSQIVGFKLGKCELRQVTTGPRETFAVLAATL